jgi:hypothetical protein
LSPPEIYDVLDDEIAILVSKEKPVGDFEAEFICKGLNGGVYFDKLLAVPVLPGGRQVGRQAG